MPDGSHVEIVLDEKELVAGLESLRDDQIPYALYKALNDTALEFQQAELDHMGKVYTIRRSDFARRSVKIKPFASKQNTTVTISIDPPGGRDAWSKFEGGGTKRPTRGARGLAVPVDAKRGKTDIVTASNRPKAFRFKAQRPVAAQRGKKRKAAADRKGASVFRGDKRTFLIQYPDGHGALFQRTGKGKGAGVKLLYKLIRSGRIPANLNFQALARQTITARVRANFERRYAEALATAR